jgi:hypothetical protein
MVEIEWEASGDEIGSERTRLGKTARDADESDEAPRRAFFSEP